MKTHLVRGLCLATALTFLAAPSVGLAAPIPLTGTTSGKYVNPQGGGYGVVTTGVGTTHFTWGDPAYKPNSNQLSAPNSLHWDAESPLSGVSTEQDFKLGKLTFFNGTVWSGTVPDSVDLSINLTFTNPNVGSHDFNFQLGLYSTSNDHQDPNDNADYVYFPNTFPNTSFTIDGVDYTLEIIGFRNFGGDNAIQSDAQQFHVLEQGTAWADLYGRVTADFPSGAVPEPASIVSAAVAGVAGLGLMARRRRQAARG